jgi:hypothetical protein
VAFLTPRPVTLTAVTRHYCSELLYKSRTKRELNEARLLAIVRRAHPTLQFLESARTTQRSRHDSGERLNGRVFTGVPEKPYAEAIAIKGARIIAVDTSQNILGAGLFSSLTAPACRMHSHGTRCCTQAANACQAAVFPIGTRICSTNMRKEPAHNVARWIRRVDHRS